MIQGNSLNTSVPATALLTGVASMLGAIPIAQIILPQAPVPRVIPRICLVTTLSASDMTSGTYWDGYGIQAPFYIYVGTPAVSNLISATNIGNFNFAEYYEPIPVPPMTDIIAYWLGVVAGSAGKCQATIHQRAV